MAKQTVRQRAHLDLVQADIRAFRDAKRRFTEDLVLSGGGDASYLDKWLNASLPGFLVIETRYISMSYRLEEDAGSYRYYSLLKDGNIIADAITSRGCRALRRYVQVLNSYKL